MKRKIVILLGLLVLVFLPGILLADCRDFSRVTGSYIQNERTIIFYEQYAPIAQVILTNCTVASSSNILLLKNYMCDSDHVIVDGQKCAILTLNSASGGSLDLGK